MGYRVGGVRRSTLLGFLCVLNCGDQSLTIELEVMKHDNQALKVALAAAQQLSPRLQRQLAEQLLTFAAPDQHTVLVYLQRLSPQRPSCLEQLMINITRDTSRRQKGESCRNALRKSIICCLPIPKPSRALRPELFDERGKPVRKRFQRAVREPSSRLSTTRQENRRE